ncbi:MAG: hypothetical protein ACKE5M_01980 [Methylophilaceae bacterium]
MNILKTIIAAVAITAAAVSTVHARDSFSIGINIGGHGYASHSAHRYHHSYGHHRAPTVYYSAPRVVYYSSPVRYRHYRHDSYSENRHYGHAYRGGSHYKSRHHNKHSRKHKRRHHNRGHGYHNGWR